LLEAIRENRSLEIHYQSMGRERTELMWRRITPHGFGYDGLRWHVRAFCHLDSKFKDFLLPRILGTRRPGEPGDPAEEDRLWTHTFGIEIGPHPDLTPSQKAVVARDYGMRQGRAVLTVRYAMLFYVLRRLGLLADTTKYSSRIQHIVVLNDKALTEALRVAELKL
jgi:predicted DNA-binding transcriptional regulator YafY